MKNIEKKMLKELEQKNDILLNILSYIEFDLNLSNFESFSENENSIIYIANIHSIIESTFSKFYLKLNGNFKNDYKIYNQYNDYLLDIIKFYNPFSKSILGNVLISENLLILDKNIKNINDFVIILKK